MNLFWRLNFAQWSACRMAIPGCNEQVRPAHAVIPGIEPGAPIFNLVVPEMPARPGDSLTVTPVMNDWGAGSDLPSPGCPEPRPSADRVSR